MPNTDAGGFSGSDLDKVGAREVLDALPDGAYITNLDRKILFWSRAAEKITGWPAGEVTGHTCADNILVHVDKDGHQLCGKEHCPLHRSGYRVFLCKTVPGNTPP